MEHKRDFGNAWQDGYDDAMYDGRCAPDELPCQCAECLLLYQAGQDAAIAELSDVIDRQEGR